MKNRRIFLLITVFLSALLLFAAAPAESGRGGILVEPGEQQPSGGDIDDITGDIPKTEEREALPLYGLVIGIDPGHQAKADTDKEPVAPGSSVTKAKVAAGTRGVATGRPEYAVNLEISLLLRDILTDLGARVIMTRETDDVNISNIERAVMMNEQGADAVIRIHCNGSTNRALHGAGMYVRKTGSMAEESARLGECLLTAMKQIPGWQTHSVYRRDSYTGLNWSEVPCVLAEVGYLTNPDEDKRLSDTEWQTRIAIALARGIAAYFGG